MRGDNRGHPVSDPHNKHYNKGETLQISKEINTMSTIEITSKIEALRELEELIEEAKAEAETLRDEIKAEMMARDIEELSVGQFIVRFTSILSNRFDTTGFKRAYADLYKQYTKQTASRRFTISV